MLHTPTDRKESTHSVDAAPPGGRDARRMAGVDAKRETVVLGDKTLRSKRMEDELRDRLRIVKQSQRAPRTAMAAEKVGRDAFWLTSGVKIGLALLVVLSAMGGIYYRFAVLARLDDSALENIVTGSDGDAQQI